MDKDMDTPDPATGLTPREKTAVKDSWAVVLPDIRPFGIDVLYIFFEDHPEYQAKFVQLKDLPLKDIKENKKFAAHASSVLHAVASFVDAIDDTGLLLELLYRIAESHRKRDIPPIAFTHVKEAILKGLKNKLGDILSSDAEVAWDKTLSAAINVIIERIKQGPPQQ